MSVSCLGSETGIGTLCGSAWSRESQQPLPQIICDKILFSHTRRWYEFLFLHFFLFRYLLFYVIINFYRNYFIVIIIFLNFFFMKIIFIFSRSGMFRNVPECSMFRVLSTPSNIIGRLKTLFLVRVVTPGLVEEKFESIFHHPLTCSNQLDITFSRTVACVASVSNRVIARK